MYRWVISLKGKKLKVAEATKESQRWLIQKVYFQNRLSGQFLSVVC
jgi:hypothetical protein